MSLGLTKGENKRCWVSHSPVVLNTMTQSNFKKEESASAYSSRGRVHRGGGGIATEAGSWTSQLHMESRGWGRGGWAVIWKQSCNLSKPDASDLFSRSRLHRLKDHNPTTKEHQHWAKGSSMWASMKHFSFKLPQVVNCLQASLSSTEAGELWVKRFWILQGECSSWEPRGKGIGNAYNKIILMAQK